jgi:hypothetical protein
MRIFILFIILIFSLSSYSQGAPETNSIFIRVYDLDGKKIAKGKRYTISDSTITFLKRNNVIVNLNEIGSIKTRRSAGNFLLLTSALGGGFGLLSNLANDDNMGTNMLSGVALGAGIGLITLPFKKSDTQIINADQTQWNAFVANNANAIDKQDSLPSVVVVDTTVYKKVFLRVYDLNGKKIAEGRNFGLSDSAITFRKNKINESVPLEDIGSIRINGRVWLNIVIPASMFGISGGLGGVAAEALSGQDGVAAAGFFGGIAIGALIGVATLPFKKKYYNIEINGDQEQWHAFRELIKE